MSRQVVSGAAGGRAHTNPACVSSAPSHCCCILNSSHPTNAQAGCPWLPSSLTLVHLCLLHGVAAKDEERVAAERQLAAAAWRRRRLPRLGPQRRPLELLQVEAPHIVEVSGWVQARLS